MLAMSKFSPYSIDAPEKSNPAPFLETGLFSRFSPPIASSVSPEWATADSQTPNRPSSASNFAADDSGLKNEERPVRIMIVDDHEALRRGLRAALAGAGWQICGEATNGREAIDEAARLKPDLIILDVSMPIMNGLEAAKAILGADTRVKIVAFTMHESQQIKNEMERIGVHAQAAKSAPLADLLATIKSVLAKGSPRVC